MGNATKKTMANFKNGRSPENSGSESTDLGGASRIVPLAIYYGDNPEKFIQFAEQQTIMTHNHPQVFIPDQAYTKKYSQSGS